MHIIVWVALLPIDKYYADPLLLDRPEILALSTTEKSLKPLPEEEEKGFSNHH